MGHLKAPFFFSTRRYTSAKRRYMKEGNGIKKISVIVGPGHFLTQFVLVTRKYRRGSLSSNHGTRPSWPGHGSTPFFGYFEAAAPFLLVWEHLILAPGHYRFFSGDGAAKEDHKLDSDSEKSGSEVGVICTNSVRQDSWVGSSATVHSMHENRKEKESSTSICSHAFRSEIRSDTHEMALFQDHGPDRLLPSESSSSASRCSARLRFVHRVLGGR